MIINESKLDKEETANEASIHHKRQLELYWDDLIPCEIKRGLTVMNLLNG